MAWGWRGSAGPTAGLLLVHARLQLLLLAAAVVTCAACNVIYEPPQIRLNTQLNTVDVVGLGSACLDELAKLEWTTDEWQKLLRVSVKDSNNGGSTPPPVAGRYAIVGPVLRFTPMFPFDEGRQYDVVLDRGFMPPNARMVPDPHDAVTAVVGRPAVARSPSTVVTQVYPSSDVLPANQLRMYLHFSAPMDWRSGYDYVKLVDERGQEVVDAFLPLDADFWNDDRTRYTVFFDPGRVKRGILPNRQMGRALEAGRRYTLVVKREWRDGHGLPLKEEYRRDFRAGPAIERALSMTEWRIAAPEAGTRDPLTVTFPNPLDRGLLARALGAARNGRVVEGQATIEDAETRWSFAPRDPWAPGDHDLVALSFLEDLAGNRVGRAFEVDNFERTDATAEPERRTLRFVVKPR
jgi:hypothetical protein